MHYDSSPSIWNLSELLTWLDFGFIPDADNTDVENYCSLMGAYEVCSMFRGIVPIVHGPIGCLSSYYSTRIATRLSGKIKPLPFSTCMDKNDVIFGAVEKLENSIKEIDEMYKPRLIVVLTTCVSDMIAEDIQTVIRRLNGKISADIIPMQVGGISCKGFRDGTDQAFKILMNYVYEKSPYKNIKEKNSVNLFLRRVHGKLSDQKDLSEIKRILGVNNISINSVIRVGMTYDELLEIPKAQANITLCYTYGKETMKYMENLFEQKYSQTSYPIGLTGTLDWVKTVSDILGVEDSFSHSNEIKEMRDELQKLKEFLSKTLKEKKMFIWHPGEKALAFIKLATDLELEPILIGFTYFLIKTTRGTIINLINGGYDPKVIIRGHSKLWTEYENNYSYYERPMLFMPKKFWLGNLPCVDIDLFRDQSVGISGLKNIINNVYNCYTKQNTENNSIFDKYIERRYEKVEWNTEIESIVRK
jgi:nitrogenase molybdenum-iron protein alpha/beta subunit